jgi:hypothetical protein
MIYVVEIDGKDGQTDYKFFDNLRSAEDRYYRALGAVTQGTLVATWDGKLVRLARCRMFEVPSKNLAAAKKMIANNEAPRLQDSDDSQCGNPVILEGLFMPTN